MMPKACNQALTQPQRKELNFGNDCSHGLVYRRTVVIFQRSLGVGMLALWVHAVLAAVHDQVDPQERGPEVDKFWPGTRRGVNTHTYIYIYIYIWP